MRMGINTKAHPNSLSCLTSVFAGYTAARTGNIIGALICAMRYRWSEHGYGRTEDKEHPINPVIKTDDLTVPHDLTTLTLEQLPDITIAPGDPIHPVFYVCLGCTSVITTAGLSHNCQKTDSVEHLEPDTLLANIELDILNQIITDENIIKMRKATMDNGVIKLGAMPLENILLLKDSNEVFYICNLKEDNLNKINGCHRIRTSEGKHGIKVLDLKIEVSDINETGKYMLFDYFVTYFASVTASL